MSEELQPCPFCGKAGKEWIDNGAKVYGCSDYENCNRPRPINELKDSWNKAYCWKEIDSLKSKLAIAEEALERIEKIDGPVFNGEKVTTLNPYQIDTWQRIAKEALAKLKEGK